MSGFLIIEGFSIGISDMIADEETNKKLLVRLQTLSKQIVNTPIEELLK